MTLGKDIFKGWDLNPQIKKERKELEENIREKSRLYELSLDEKFRGDLVYLHEEYRRKYGKEFKG